jgi:hypothetical protein
MITPTCREARSAGSPARRVLRIEALKCGANTFCILSVVRKVKTTSIVKALSERENTALPLAYVCPWRGYLRVFAIFYVFTIGTLHPASREGGRWAIEVQPKQ